MEYVTLNNGVAMPILGYGVYQISPEECQRCVRDAIEVGYRSIDTAQIYHNEEGVGKAVAECGLARSEFFLTTKIWISNAGYEKAKRSIEESLHRLRTDYIDLFLIHQPFGDYYGSWRAMTEAYYAGKLRAIGVSNFYPDRLVDFCKFNEVIPAVNQVETHPLMQQVEANEFMKKYGVQIESWAPFAEGRRKMFENPALVAIAERCGKTVPQVILRWLIQRGIVVIPKSTHKERMESNFHVFDFQLTDEDMKTIATLNEEQTQFLSHRDPEKVEFLTGLV